MCYIISTVTLQSESPSILPAAPDTVAFKFITNFRPLLVLTGTVHIEGGMTSKAVRVAQSATDAQVTMHQSVSDARKRANAIASKYSRSITRTLRLLKTPFGALVDPADARRIQTLLVEITQTAAKFNTRAVDCQVFNCFVLENLHGVRLASFTGWFNRRMLNKDPEALAALPKLLQP